MERGIDFDDLPTWQRRGIGVYWVGVEREGFNPVTEETTVCQRRELHVDFDLPSRDEYSEFVRRHVGA